MIENRTLNPDFIAMVAERLQLSDVAMIYFSIDGLEQAVRKYGDEPGKTITSSISRMIANEIELHGEKIECKTLGNDFFFLFQMADSLQALQQLTYHIKDALESGLAKRYSGLSGIHIATGCTKIRDLPDHDPEAMIYFAMKRLLQTAKQSREKDENNIIQEFYDILLRKKIYSVYQPIVSLADMKIFGYEALTRGPEHSVFQSPLKLFEYAGKEGTMYVLDRLAREKAIEGLPFLNKGQKAFINISVDILHDPEFAPGQTLKLLERYGFTPDQVVFEITERSSVEDFTTMKQILRHYRNQGYQIAIDDAGAGYSSLQAIAELHPDYIKVDRSLISDIHTNKMKTYILENFVSLANKMEIRIIAEGIEQLEELVHLRSMGIHYGQGFLLGRPLKKPAKELLPDNYNFAKAQKA